jgi:cyclin-dependent kinase
MLLPFRVCAVIHVLHGSLCAHTLSEMHLGRPLFPGQSESSQRDLLFQQLGTPTDATLPGVSDLPKWKAAPPTRLYPAPPSLGHLLPDLSEDGVDLLTKMLTYNPAKRISAAAAMEHPVFSLLCLVFVCA